MPKNNKAKKLKLNISKKGDEAFYALENRAKIKKPKSKNKKQKDSMY